MICYLTNDRYLIRFEEEMAGYVYAWKVPIVLNTGAAPIDEELCLVKIGKAEPHKLWKRLYAQRLSWGKILGHQLRNDEGNLRTKTVGTREYPVLDMSSQCPSIPYSTGELTADETLDKCEEVFGQLELYPDFGFFLERRQEHHVNDDEQYIRALLGLPARPTFVSRIVEAWNHEAKFNGQLKKIAPVITSQIGFTEFIITTEAQFNKVRAAFMECESFEDFTLANLTAVLATANSIARTVLGINIQVTLPLGYVVGEVHCIRFTRYIVDAEMEQLRQLLGEAHIHANEENQEDGEVEEE